MKKSAFLLCAALLASTAAFAADAKKAGNAAKGKELFEVCSACHATATDEKVNGPSLKGLFKRAKMKNGKAVNDANVSAIITHGGNGMPPNDHLTAEEKAHLVAYLKTL